ncbi:unnamed protein product [Nippostrongylus brasiliensis]|uniref:Lysocardiolipin acyltransferase 1 (inferred by orthology to a human protein) n=1 Tax=Nippostrongylus brasiliensis TaxID=27835 RepID=A0A0N4YN25_NIPBR|nr:unnamed protein product [Nippostrongylus brasiliensis]
MFGRINGVIFVVLLFITSYLGCIFLLFPVVPFLFLAPSLWRKCADSLVGYWLTFPAFSNELTKILDWLFLFNVLYKIDPLLLTTEKISLKAPLKRIPGAGWAMSAGSYIFLERSFERDKTNMAEIIEYYKKSGNIYQLLLFPEGTDRGVRAAAQSEAFAKKNGLCVYDYVLHPRITGFNYLLNLMRQQNYISYIYDITLAYEDVIIDSEMTLLKEGVFPKNVHFDIKRYNIDEIPTDPQQSGKWLTDLWQGKEKKLKDLYSMVKTQGIGYYLTAALWITKSAVWLYLMYLYNSVRIYVLFVSLFYMVVLRHYNGLEFLAIKWFRSKRKSV